MNVINAIPDELFEVARRLDSIEQNFAAPEISQQLDIVQDAATRVGRASSGSWLGYHSRTYYRNLEPPPPGAHFSVEWGLKYANSIGDTRGSWEEFDFDYVRNSVYEIAGNPDLKPAEELGRNARNVFEEARDEILSLLTTSLGKKHDSFLERLKKEAEEAKLLALSDIVSYYRPTSAFVSLDMVAFGQGPQAPPHIQVLAYVGSLRHPVQACARLSKIAQRAASHLAKRERHGQINQEMGTSVFIGHGRSLIWKELKDFIQDRLALPWDEFNRVPIAGITNITRLSQMLDEAGIAFIVMTAEDEQTDGKMRARMNVIHEAGLFQGKLGFTKAIILLEEECEEFSNIEGLGQIRFPKGNIQAAFEEIRQVLEREGIIPS
ncbi:MAG: TIR domain-containing protein [Acidobacteriota bacterium]